MAQLIRASVWVLLALLLTCARAPTGTALELRRPWRQLSVKKLVSAGLLGWSLSTQPALASYGGFSVEDLPPQSQKVLLSNAQRLVFAVDAYVFDVAEDLEDATKWASVLGQLQSSSDARFVSVSRVERDVISPLRSLSQGIPEDAGGSDLAEAAVGLDTSMTKLRNVLSGNTITVFDAAGATGSAVPAEVQKQALALWEDGRQALNKGIEVVNALVEDYEEKNFEIQKIPAMKESKDYSRNRERYMKYKIDAAKCQQGGVGVNVCQSLFDKYVSK